MYSCNACKDLLDSNKLYIPYSIKSLSLRPQDVKASSCFCAIVKDTCLYIQACETIEDSLLQNPVHGGLGSIRFFFDIK